MSSCSELLDRLVARKLTDEEETPPFFRSLGFPYPISWSPGRVAARWTVDPRFLHEQGGLFGGFLAALSDYALAMATLSVLEDGEIFTTSDLRTCFFHSITGGELDIEAAVIHRGRRMIHAEVLFTREDGRLVAKATATQLVSQESSCLRSLNSTGSPWARRPTAPEVTSTALEMVARA